MMEQYEADVIVVGAGTAGKLKAHYLQFPPFPSGFDEWAATARKLWEEQVAL